MNPPPRTAGPRAARQPSKLLSGLFRKVDSGRRLTVLEVGSALPETVEFFSQYYCRIHFVDLFSEPFVTTPASDRDQSEWLEFFSKQLDFPEGTRLDICLFWDFLTFLDDTALRAFNDALAPWIHEGTTAHGFGVHHLAVKLEHVQYGIIDRDTVSVRRRPSLDIPYHPHSQTEMADMFSRFVFERGLLLPNGKLEMLLKYRQ